MSSIPSLALPSTAMRFRTPVSALSLLGLLSVTATGALAAPQSTVDEATFGDLSNDHTAPSTFVAPGAGTVTISAGQQGFQTPADPEDVDYLTVTIPAGFQLAGLFLEDYVAVAGNTAFLGLRADTSYPNNANNTFVPDLLGGALYGSFLVGTDILPNTLAFAGTGATVPLPAGDYTFWFNQTDDPSALVLRLDIEAASFGTSFCNPAVANSTGVPGETEAIGSDVLADNDLMIRCFNLPPNQFGLPVVSTTEVFNPNPGGSLGNLCLGGNLGRYNNQVQSTGAAGEFFIDVDLTAIPQPSAFVAAMAGETWRFQLWHRDISGGMFVSNFTDGVAVTLQ